MCFVGNQTNFVSVQSEESVVEITKTPDIAKKHADSVVNKVHFTNYNVTFLLSESIVQIKHYSSNFQH